MLLSQDVPQDCEVNWAATNLLGVAYKVPESRRKEFRDSEGKYVCNRCGKSYKATTSLSRHKRLECGVMPCEICPICDRRFKHKFVLNSHIVGCQRKLRDFMGKKKNDWRAARKILNFFYFPLTWYSFVSHNLCFSLTIQLASIMYIYNRVSFSGLESVEEKKKRKRNSDNRYLHSRAGRVSWNPSGLADRIKNYYLLFVRLLV